MRKVRHVDIECSPDAVSSLDRRGLGAGDAIEHIGRAVQFGDDRHPDGIRPIDRTGVVLPDAVAALVSRRLLPHALVETLLVLM